MITDSEGGVLFGDGSSPSATVSPIVLADRRIGFVHGRHAQSVCRWLQVLASQDDESRALGQESLDRYREVTVMYAVSEKIVGASDPIIIAQIVCEESARFLQCDSAVVLLLNPETNRLEITAAHGVAFHDRTAREIEDDVVASVLRTGHAEIVNDVFAEPRSLAARNTLQSIICCPLKSHDRVFGVLVAGSEHQREFSAGELQALGLISAHAAASIEAARMDRARELYSHKPAAIVYAAGERPPWANLILLAMQHFLIALISPGVSGSGGPRGGGILRGRLVGRQHLSARHGGGYRPAGVAGGEPTVPAIWRHISHRPSSLANYAVGNACRVSRSGQRHDSVCRSNATDSVTPDAAAFANSSPRGVGVVVLMLGITIVPVALPRMLLGVNTQAASAEPANMAWVVGTLTLGMIVLLSVLPYRRIRLYATADCARGRICGCLRARDVRLAAEGAGHRVTHAEPH